MTEKKERILVVDDELNIRNLMKTMLEGEGYSVDAEANGPGTGVSGPAGEPTEHLEHQRWRPGPARS